MDNLRTVILIWGTAIVLYLFLANANGTKTLLGSLTSFTTGTTTVLQGR